MSNHLPKAVLLTVLGGMALAGCTDGIYVRNHTEKGTLNCPNMDPVAQKYVRGTPNEPVRCGPQKVNYWTPEVSTTGKIVTPAS